MCTRCPKSYSFPPARGRVNFRCVQTDGLYWGRYSFHISPPMTCLVRPLPLPYRFTVRYLICLLAAYHVPRQGQGGGGRHGASMILPRLHPACTPPARLPARRGGAVRCCGAGLSRVQGQGRAGRGGARHGKARHQRVCVRQPGGRRQQTRLREGGAVVSVVPCGGTR